jgi:4-hydroxy-2-oxoheptanedioate aldolase
MKSLDAGAYRRHLPDGQHPRRRAEPGRVDALCAARERAASVPIRASIYGGADYPQHANDTIVTFAMIETAQALDNLDAIMSVEGLDAIYIGPSDLSLSLGCRPVLDDVDPKASEAIDHVLARAKAHGLIAAIHNGTPEQALARAGQGLSAGYGQLRWTDDRGRLAADPVEDERTGQPSRHPVHTEAVPILPGPRS